MENTDIKILAIDNNSENLIGIKEIISAVFPNGTVITALHETGGVELAITENPDVIILNAEMSGTGGIGICRHLKKNAFTADIPVIFLMNADEKKEFLHEALEAGAEAFQTLPLDKIEMTAIVRAMIKIKAANEFRQSEKTRFNKQVAERTRMLEHSQTAIMSLLKDLKESEQRFRTIFENIPDAYYEAGLDGIILEVSPSITIVTEGQYGRGELIGKSMNIFYPDRNERSNLIAILQQRGNVSDFPITLKNRDSTVVPCSISAKLTFDRQGKPEKIVGSLRNISERKKSEESLRLSESRLTRAELATKSGNWELRLETLSVNASTGAGIIYGVTKRNLSYSEIKSLRLPEYWTMMDDAFKGLVERDEPYDIEFKIRAADTGAVKDIHSIAFFDKDRNTVFGIIQDITDNTTANEALQKSERQKRLILQTTLDGFWIIDRQRRFLEVNDAYCRLTGYSREEIMSMNVHDIAVGDKEEEARERIARVMQNGTERFEGRHRCKDGTIVSLEISIHYMTDDGNFFMFLHDITERKLHETRITALLREKELILKEVHHRVKNNMNTIFGLLTIQANAQTAESTKTILLDSACRVQSMMLLYEKLYRSECNTDLSLRAYFPALINEILGIFPLQIKIKTVTEIGDIVMNASTLTPLGIILNELITNTMKYAFVNVDQGIIRVSAVKIENKIVIEYSDNGIGIPESVSFDNSSGFGMQLMTGLVKQIHGTITLDRSQGTKFRLELEDSHA